MVYHLLAFSRIYNFRVAIISSSSNMDFEFWMRSTQKKPTETVPILSLHQTNRSPGYIELNDASEADDLQPSQGRDLPGQTSHGATQSHPKLPVYQGSRMMNGETIIANVLQYWWRISARMHNDIKWCFLFSSEYIEHGLVTSGSCRILRPWDVAIIHCLPPLGHEHPAHKSTTTIARKSPNPNKVATSQESKSQDLFSIVPASHTEIFSFTQKSVIKHFLCKFPTLLEGFDLGECAQAIGNFGEFDVQELGQISWEPAMESWW